MPKQLPAHLRIPLMYTLFSAAWILLSDHLAAFLVPDAAALTYLQTFKGWAFVLCSAFLIHQLVRAAVLRSQSVEHDLRQVNRALNVLSTTNRALVHAQDEQVFLTTICQVCVEVGSYRLAWIALTADDKQTPVRLAAHMGSDDGYLGALTAAWPDLGSGQGPMGAALRTGQPCVIRNMLEEVSAAPWRAAAARHGYASSIALPLAHDGKTLGALNLYAAEVNAFDPTEVHLLTELARDLAYGLASLRVRVEREHLAKDLRTSQELLSRIVETVPEGILALDCDDRIVFANPASEQMLGLSPAGPARAAFPFTQMLRLGQPVSGVEQIVHAPDGQRMIVSVNAAPLRDTLGEIVGIVAALSDVTARKREAALLATQFAISRLLIERGSLSAIAPALLQTICEGLQWDTGELWQCSRPDAAASRVAVWYCPELEALAPAPHERARPWGAGLVARVCAQPQSLWLDAADDPGAPYGLAGMRSAVAFPIRAADEITGVVTLYARAPRSEDADTRAVLDSVGQQVGLFVARGRAVADLADERNLLAQRVAERTSALSSANVELERAVRAKDEFLANMSHELRTPLNAILGSCELLLEQIPGPLSERQLRMVAQIDTSGRHLLDLITDILDLAKVEAGQMGLQRQPVPIDDVCRASVLFVQEQAARKRLQLSVAIDDQLAWVEADPRRLKQILVNLLANAVKFTEPGGRVHLAVSVDSGAGMVRFVVEDSGIGIAPEDLTRLFRPFIQVDSSLSRQYEGTGLGLALVRRLAELHGGGVAVESAVGVGSRFTVSLPYTPPPSDAAPPAAPPPGNAAGQSPALAGARHPSRTEEQPKALIAPEARQEAARAKVLLAEDNELTIAAISSYLQAKGYNVVVARTGQEAIERAGEDNPAVILMDVQMPVMDGLEATRRLRATPAFARTPIIALTALAMPGDRERCLEAGATEYLTKPVNLRGLAALIDRLLAVCHSAL